MKPTEKAKVTVLVTHSVPLDQLKKWASSKPCAGQHRDRRSHNG